MRILAVAKPNARYEHFANLRHVLIQARLTERRKIFYYEIHTDNPKWIKRLSEDNVKSFFERSSLIANQPFLKKENPEFCIVLYRKRKFYHEKFINLRDKPVFRRGKK